MAFFDIDGGRLHYEARGDGLPLVFVHGLACAHEDWRDQVSRFASSHRVVSLDLRRHGRSTGHASGFDMLTFGGDLVALIAHLELAPSVLVGHSMGCRVVLECARRAPDVVAGLVLIDGSRLAAASPDAARRDVRDAIRETGYDAFFERLFTQMFTPASDRGTRDAIVARARRLPEDVGMALMAEMVAWDTAFAEQALSAVNVPMTVIQSTHLNARRERVPLRPGESSPWLELAKELAPHTEIAVVPGVGHFTMIEAPGEVSRHIDGIIDRLR